MAEFTCVEVRTSLEDQLENVREAARSQVAAAEAQVRDLRVELRTMKDERDQALAELAEMRADCTCGAAPTGTAAGPPAPAHGEPSRMRIRHVCR